jgi:nickel transport protein
MMKLPVSRLGIGMAALLWGSVGALAHGAWIAERWGELGVIYGHGAGDDPYDPAKITKVEAVDGAGQLVSVEVKAMESHAVLVPAEEPAAIVLEFDNGFWSEGADGKWVNKPKNEVPGAKSAGRYLKNNLTLLHAHDGLPELPQQSLQIRPVGNPLGLKAGDAFRVKVTFEGEPLAGATVMLDYVNAPGLLSGPTDDAGEVEVALRNDGLNVLAVDHSVPLAGDPQADEVGYTATLSFVASEHVEE